MLNPQNGVKFVQWDNTSSHKILQKTVEGLNTANGEKLKINNKVLNVEVYNNFGVVTQET